MRQRTTWKTSSETPRQAATSRQADIYDMNTDRAQPSATEYENGDPDKWAETPVPGDKMNVNDEYEGDHVKRNEIGLGEFRDDTWKHKDSDNWNGKGKYDNAKLSSERKAMAAERIARTLLRTDNEQLVEAATFDFMNMPAKVMVATLDRLHAASVEGLSKESKFKRAYACTKLAARMIGEKDEKGVEVLARTLMTIDDPTLKAIIRSVAASRVAEEQEQETKTSQEQQEAAVKPVAQEQQEAQQEQAQQEEQAQAKPIAQQEEQAAPAAPVAQQEEQAQQQEQAQQEEQAMLAPEDMALLDEMLQHEMGECAPGAAPPAAAAPAQDSLQALFEAPPAPAPTSPMMAAAKRGGVEISFDGDVDGSSEHIASLDDLFADDPEVQAQRQIAATAAESLGFARTASAGAKKLGQVRAAPATTEIEKLSHLWERP